jgi:hypothetical protein
MRGRRLLTPDPSEEVPHPLPLGYKRGDYWFDPTQEIWFACTPNGLIANLEKHTIQIHEDGTITAWPSILVTGHTRVADGVRGNEIQWHGFLEKGIWRDA